MLKYFTAVNNSRTAVDDSQTAMDDSHTAVATAKAAMATGCELWLCAVAVSQCFFSVAGGCVCELRLRV